MNTSVFLGQAFGIYLIVAGVFALLRYNFYQKVVEELASSPALTLTVGMFTLILGILIVLSHNIWVSGWPVIITLLGYATLLKGLLCFLFPGPFLKYYRMLLTRATVYVNGAIYVALGIYLCVISL